MMLLKKGRAQDTNSIRPVMRVRLSNFRGRLAG
jgi:hypothetical protein